METSNTRREDVFVVFVVVKCGGDERKGRRPFVGRFFSSGDVNVFPPSAPQQQKQREEQLIVCCCCRRRLLPTSSPSSRPLKRKPVVILVVTPRAVVGREEATTEENIRLFVFFDERAALCLCLSFFDANCEDLFFFALFCFFFVWVVSQKNKISSLHLYTINARCLFCGSLLFKNTTTNNNNNKKN